MVILQKFELCSKFPLYFIVMYNMYVYMFVRVLPGNTDTISKN